MAKLIPIVPREKLLASPKKRACYCLVGLRYCEQTDKRGHFKYLVALFYRRKKLMIHLNSSGGNLV